MTSESATGARNAAQDERTLQSISDAVARLDLAQAALLADAALATGLEHPATYSARALWHEKEGRLDEALANYHQAKAIAPKHFELLNALGLCLCRAGRYREAMAVFDEAIPLNPAAAAIHYRKGWASELAGDFDSARRAYERAILLVPTHGEALAGLAMILMRTGDAKKARHYAERALKVDPAHPGAILALAEVEIVDGQCAAAETRLRALLNAPRLLPQSRAMAFGLLGDALDGQDRAAEAFARYAQQNSELQHIHAPRMAGAPTVAELLNGLIAYLESSERWRAADEGADGAARGHVFLAGFPRSGAARVAQILARSKTVLSLESREYLAEPAQMFLGDGAGLAALADLQDPLLGQIRQDYWQLVREQNGDVANRIVVDKLPLNTLRLPLIAKLFPRAKIVFSLRDPRDVVFGSFRRHFESNAAMYEMLTLEGAARTYASAMRFYRLAREKLPLELMEQRHEELLDDAEGPLRRVCDFLGVEWQDDMIAEPNYRAEGASRWRSYASELSPVLPILRPWVETFAYPAE